jgi:MtN3 and saliva related transmembrane protein
MRMLAGSVYNNKTPAMSFENIIGIVAGIITSASMLPQLIKVLKEEDASSLSIVMICVLIAGLSLWVYYGVLKNELPIILSNSFAVLMNLTLLLTCFLYRNRSKST